MTASMSKRNQARNEKALQELIKTVPGNDRCADCGARNPGTSLPPILKFCLLQLGIFLCMRCASLHRKLGTHISKVKSLSMDSWSNEQVEHMRRNGNTNTNRTYNPKNTKPAIPLDVDEVDAALERFIRQKYDQQVFSGGRTAPPAGRQDTGSTRSSDDQPPPLPPKPTKRFGFAFRSASSALPDTKYTRRSPPRSPEAADPHPLPPLRVNKQSRVFGASVGGSGENLDAKLATLRDMGFTDDKRNSSILKGLNGNMERAIETLVRLGEGNTPGSRPRSPSKPRQVAVSQPPGSTQPFSSVGVEPPWPSNGVLSSPAEATVNVQPTSQSTSTPTSSGPRSFSPSNPFQQPQPYNPFETANPQTSTWPLEKAFEGMQVSQPLFPNATGGYPIQPPHTQDVRFQQSMTPPIPQQTYQTVYNPFNVQQVSPLNNNYNPFYQPVQQTLPQMSTYPQPNPQPQYNLNLHNPFGLPPSVQPPQGSNITQSPQDYTQQSHLFQTPAQLPAPQILQASNPYTTQQAPQIQQPQSFQPSNPYQIQPMQPQPTGRVDKSSILALYNYPHLAPPPPPPPPLQIPNGVPDPTEPVSTNNTHHPSNLEPQLQQQPSSSTFPSSSSSTSAKPPPPAPQQQHRSITMPTHLIPGSRNPFTTTSTTSSSSSTSKPAPPPPFIPTTMPNNNAVASTTAAAGLSRHVSQESADIAGMQSGRHSPDAFASLSARFMR
ncbi:MAG: hypothetical protein Q9190_005586 [Brigantiaea leucoxantha]